MADDNSTPAPRPKRQRNEKITIRCYTAERDAIRANADKAGLAVGAFLRATGAGNAGPRAQRRPPADHQVLRQILGHLGRIGNNINQISRRLNAGANPDIPELREALAANIELRDGILAALGVKPKAPAPPDHPPKTTPANDRKRKKPRRS